MKVIYLKILIFDIEISRLIVKAINNNQIEQLFTKIAIDTANKKIFCFMINIFFFIFKNIFFVNFMRYKTLF